MASPSSFREIWGTDSGAATFPLSPALNFPQNCAETTMVGCAFAPIFAFVAGSETWDLGFKERL